MKEERLTISKLAHEYIKIRRTRWLRASPESVFDAWLDVDHAREWLFSTASGQMIWLQIDPRVGGLFLAVERRDGVDIERLGQYLEIERPRRLVFTLAVPQESLRATRVTVQLKRVKRGCKLRLIHEGIIPESIRRTETGWSRILDGLGVEASRVGSRRGLPSPPILTSFELLRPAPRQTDEVVVAETDQSNRSVRTLGHLAGMVSILLGTAKAAVGPPSWLKRRTGGSAIG